MPLTAIVQSTGQQIVIADDLEFAKEHKHELVCPICEQPLIPVRDFLRLSTDTSVNAYARHKEIRGHYETNYRYHTESTEHFAAKKYLAANVGELFGLKVVAHRYEVRMSDVMRIADVVLELDGGDVLIVEAQLSATTPEELEERTNDYERLGYTVLWGLGKDAYKDYNYRWCLSRSGVYIRLDFAADGAAESANRRAAA